MVKEAQYVIRLIRQVQFDTTHNFFLLFYNSVLGTHEECTKKENITFQNHLLGTNKEQKFSIKQSAVFFHLDQLFLKKNVI